MFDSRAAAQGDKCRFAALLALKGEPPDARVPARAIRRRERRRGGARTVGLRRAESGFRLAAREVHARADSPHAQLLVHHEPAFLVCYGTTRRRDFERIVRGPFDADGFRVCGRTVCAITMRPQAGSAGAAAVFLDRPWEGTMPARRLTSSAMDEATFRIVQPYEFYATRVAVVSRLSRTTRRRSTQSCSRGRR